MPPNTENNNSNGNNSSVNRVIQPSANILKELEDQKNNQVSNKDVAVISNIPSISSLPKPIEAPINLYTKSSESVINVGKFTNEDQVFENQKRSKKKLLLLVLVGISSLTFMFGIIFCIFYFLILPKNYDNNYLMSVKTPYKNQTNQMLSVYESLGRPVFTSNNTTPESDIKDYAYSTSVINKANSLTDTLNKANHLNVLPGTKSLSSVKTTDTTYKRMQNYINDSQNLLMDYQSLVNYMSQFTNIVQNQLVPLDSAPCICKSTNIDQILSYSQNASSSLSSVVTAMNALSPPADLKSFNSSMINDLSALGNDYNNLASGIKSGDYNLYIKSANELIKDSNNLQDLSNFDFSGFIQKSSQIHKEIIKLESENPLGPPKNVINPSVQPHSGIST